MKVKLFKVEGTIYLADAASTETELKRAMCYTNFPEYIKRHALGELRTIQVTECSSTELSELQKIEFKHQQELFRYAAKVAQTQIVCDTYDSLRAKK